MILLIGTLTKFTEKIPQEIIDKFKSIIVEGQLVAGTFLQAALGAADSFHISGYFHSHGKVLLTPLLWNSKGGTSHN